MNAAYLPHAAHASVRPRAPRRALATVLAVIVAMLVAAGCGGSSSDSKDDAKSAKESKSDAPALGMREDAICTVYGGAIDSDDLEELASFYEDLVESREAIEDADDIELADEDGAGRLEPLEVYGLHALVEQAVVEHVADEKDIDVPSDDDALEQFSRDAFDTDSDGGEAILEAADDEVSGVQDKVLSETATVMTLDSMADEIDRYDGDSASEVLDELLDEADDDEEVQCGDEVEYFKTDGFLEDGDGKDFEPHDVIKALLVDSKQSLDENGSDPVDPPASDDDGSPAVRAGIEYEDKVVPIINDFVPLINRFASVTRKLTSGTISVSSTAEGFRKQAGFADRLAARTRAIKVDDPYLMRANAHLAMGYSAYADAMNAMGSLDKATTDAQIDRQVAIAGRNLTRMDTQFKQWDAALSKDPEGRVFARTGAAAATVEAAANALEF